MCVEGKIEGVTKFGRVWDIPVDAKKATDNRITNGYYVNWRNTSKNNKIKE